MPISLKLKEIFKKYFRAMFIYMVVSYNQNFSQIKKFFQKHQKKKPKKNLLYFFWTKFYIWLKFRLYLTNIYINIILKFFLNISFFVEGGGVFFKMWIYIKNCAQANVKIQWSYVKMKKIKLLEHLFYSIYFDLLFIKITLYSPFIYQCYILLYEIK